MANQNHANWYVQGLNALVSAAAASEKSSSGYSAAVTSPELKAMLAGGAGEAKRQADAIEGLLRKAGGQPDGKPNKVLDGIIEEGKTIVGAANDPQVRDAAVIATSQIALHYYLAAYGTLASTAKHLGMDEDARALAGMIDYMKGKNADYTKLAEGTINRQAMAA